MKKAVYTAVMWAYSTIHFTHWLFTLPCGIMRLPMNWPINFSKKVAVPARVYLDHAAATPLLSEVVAAMRAVEDEHFANPSAVHQEGVAARQVVEGARAELARLLRIRETGIVFTGSGTESNNLAIVGALYAKHQAGTAFADMEVITTAIEHPSVSVTMGYLKSLGVTVHMVAVDTEGHIVEDDFKQLLSPKTVLVSFAYVNSEVGVVQHVSRLARAVRAYERAPGIRVLVHLDAAQAPLWLPCQLDQVHADVLSLDAGKCGGPKGVGVVAMRHGVELAPVMFGGPQERGLRPATENVVGIVGAVTAFGLAQTHYEARAKAAAALRDGFMEELLHMEGVVINGGRESRVANNVNISLPGLDSEFAVVSLDVAGIACSTKSACSGAGGGGSAVVLAMTGDAARALSTIRFSLGPNTTAAELSRAATVLREHVQKMLTFKGGVVR